MPQIGEKRLRARLSRQAPLRACWFQAFSDARSHLRVRVVLLFSLEAPRAHRARVLARVLVLLAVLVELGFVREEAAATRAGDHSLLGGVGGQMGDERGLFGKLPGAVGALVQLLSFHDLG